MIEPGGNDSALNARFQRSPEHSRHTTQADPPEPHPTGINVMVLQHLVEQDLHPAKLQTRQGGSSQACEPLNAVALLDSVEVERRQYSESFTQERMAVIVVRIPCILQPKNPFGITVDAVLGNYQRHRPGRLSRQCQQSLGAYFP